MNSVKSNLLSAKVFLKEITLLVIILFSVLIFFVANSIINFVLLIILFIIFVIILLNIIGYERSKEINKIEKLIKDIRNRELASHSDINLGEKLFSLQEEIRKMYIRSEKDINDLKKLERIRTEFLGNVSHELRTPIFAIQGYLETLLDGALEDKKVNRNFIEKANNHTQNLNNLLNDLIDISMIESGDMRLSFRYFNFAEFISGIIQELKSHADEKKLGLIVHPYNENLQIFADKNKLRQVFVNLIQNAIKYTEKGSIEIVIQEEDQFAIINIKDTGIGISNENISRIFERFYRVDKDRSREIGGTGLGLAIVKHILEAHGTKVEVKSEPGLGSTFSFKLKK